MRVALVVVAHSARLAEEWWRWPPEMAPDVALRAAGGTDDGGIGTSFDRVSHAVGELLEAGHPVAVLTDLGSATMTAATVLELLGEGVPAHIADAPLVEGSVAAAVAAGSAASSVTSSPPRRAGVPPAPPAGDVPAGAQTRTVTLVNDIGLHARRGDMANLAAGFDAGVTVSRVRTPPR